MTIDLYLQEKARWLRDHRNADVITIDPETGEPMWADYPYIDGHERKRPARFCWPPEWLHEISR